MKLLCITCFFCLLICPCILAQERADSSLTADSSPNSLHEKNSWLKILDSNMLVNSAGQSFSMPALIKNRDSRQVFFYMIAGLLLLLGLLKTFYSRYFTTLFRVFFNTSLRQSQLTDQLVQAKLPSLIFNIFFALAAGLYAYFLADHFSANPGKTNWPFLELCIGAVAGCYLVKYLGIKFAGWITNYRQEADTYIFIIFLLNKVIGILLLPFLILIIFSDSNTGGYAVFISMILLGMVLITRFFRSRALLQNRLKVTAFHFMLYVAALEILPLALIYRAVTLFLGINT